MSLIVLGTVALDNVKTPAGIRKCMLGGSAAHFAMSARLFTQVELSAVVGKDFPKRHLKVLREKNINLEALVLSDGKTFQWDGEYKKEDMNVAVTIKTELGVLMGFVPKLTPRQKKIPHVFLANYDPDVQIRLLELMERPKLIGLDSMNLWIMHKKKSLLRLMKRIDLFVANDMESRMLTGEDNLIKAAKKLRRMGPELIVIKKGEHGVIFYGDDILFSIPAYPVEEVVDPTGAGDTFAGGLMGFLASGGRCTPKALKKAVLYATTVACFNVEGFGMSRTAKLTRSDIDHRMKRLVQYVSV